MGGKHSYLFGIKGRRAFLQAPMTNYREEKWEFV